MTNCHHLLHLVVAMTPPLISSSTKSKSVEKVNEYNISKIATKEIFVNNTL
jgi:hypothetical protein